MIQYEHGINIVPFNIAGDRKYPLVDSWREYTTRRQTREEFDNFSRAPYVAVICGVGFTGKSLVAIDVDFETLGEEKFKAFFNNLIQLFGLYQQKTPHGVHLYFFTSENIKSTNVQGFFELKGHGSLVIVAGPGYGEFNVENIPFLDAERVEKLLRALEMLRRLFPLLRDEDALLGELGVKGWRSEADLKLFIRLLRAGFSDEEVGRAWALLSGKALDEEARGNATHYFAVTLKKAKEWLEREKKEEKREEKKKTTIISRVLPGGAVLEAIARKNGAGEYDDYLLVFVNGYFIVLEEYEVGGVVFRPRPRRAYPYEPYDVAEGPILPRAELIDRVFREVDTFIDAEPETKIILTAAVLLSYAQEFFETIPYIYLVGDNESGKSHTLTLLSWLCYRPFAGVSHTAADLYSYLEDDEVALTIIEDEFQGSEKDDDKMKIYKSGYKKGARVGRVVTYEGGRRIDYFNSYGLKIIAAEKLIENKGFLQRCVIIELVEGFPTKDYYDEGDYERFRILRNELLKWRMALLSGREKLESPSIPLRGRNRELFLPLLTILAGHHFHDVLLRWVEAEKQKREEEKRLSLEGLLTESVVNLLRGTNELELNELWAELISVSGGTVIRDGVLEVPHLGEVTKKLVGRRLREVFGATRLKTRRDGRNVVVYSFPVEKIGRMARKYGVKMAGDNSVTTE